MDRVHNQTSHCRLANLHDLRQQLAVTETCSLDRLPAWSVFPPAVINKGRRDGLITSHPAAISVVAIGKSDAGEGSNRLGWA